MISLRDLLTAALGTGGSGLSLLQAARERGFDGSVSLRELEAAQASADFGNFTLLHAADDGRGPWRADRFRIYFHFPDMELANTALQVTEFGRLFPQIFNGFGSEVDGLGLSPNSATTFYRFDQPANGEPTLQFTFDARVLFQFVDVPDVHDDWIGFVHQDAGGFCVATLKRNFTQANDAQMGLLTAAVVGAAAPAAPFVANPLTAVIGGIVAGAINRYHFLAGRRAWRIGKLPPVFSPLTPDKPGHIFYLETAAVHRFSSWIVELGALTGQVGLGEITELLGGIWRTLLKNWGTFGTATFQYDLDVSSWLDQIAAQEDSPFAHRSGFVVFDEADFDTADDAQASPWVQALLAEHPGLREAFP